MRSGSSARLSRFGNVATGVATAVVVFAAVPVTLIWAVGATPFEVFRHSFLSASELLDVLAIVVWVSWAVCCYPLVVSITRRVRRRDLSSAARALSLDRLGLRIASAILVVGSTATALGESAGGAAAGSSQSRLRPTTLSIGGAGLNSYSSTERYGHPPTHRRHSKRLDRDGVHVIAIGETLSNIAQAVYGDSGDWELLARRNMDRSMAPAERFIDPNQLNSGWSLVLPFTSAEVPDPSASPAANLGSKDSVSVEDFCAIGLGALGAAALARRLRRRRARGSPMAVEVADNATIDAAVLIERFQGASVLSWTERANVLLGTALRDEGDREIPRCDLVQASYAGIEFHLTNPVSWSPRGFELKNAGLIWSFPLSEVSGSASDIQDGEPWIPILLPIGTNLDGTWLVSVPPSGCVSVLGPSAKSLVSAMKLMAESWSWSESVTICFDLVELAAAVALVDTTRTDGPARSVLFIGNPELISPEIRSGCAVLTTSPEASAETIVVVDTRSATLHPLGISLQPHGLDPPLADRLTQLAEGATFLPKQLPSTDPLVVSVVPDGVPIVEVRLLTSVPRIDGLKEDLSPKRARRAIEVVAYLALHRPDPVTSDRLRTRVLGTRESDAAAKTLFNTVGAARRALGLDANGIALLPPASKSGHYRLSESIRVDVVQAMSLCAAAHEAESDEASMGLYRAALSLVEGEPLSAALSGYSWWRAEGYDARITVVLVEAACRLSELAVRAELFDLARWALERGRMIDAYSELLSRSAMTLAASSGDFARLRREWLECQRRADEMDPGCLPSEPTARLFVELSDQLSDSGLKSGQLRSD
jgi:hypothetical protein